MSLCDWIKLEKHDKLWGVSSHTGTHKRDISPYCVVIPIDQLSGMTPQEVYNSIVELVPEAEFAGLCDTVLHGVDYLRRAPTEHLREILDLWHRFKGKSERIDEICQQLEPVLGKRQKAERLASVPKPGFVYLMQCGQHYKIGASKNPETRLHQLSTQPPFDIELLYTIPTNDMIKLEKKLHKKFASKRRRGEWFTLDTQDVEYIKELTQ